MARTSNGITKLIMRVVYSRCNAKGYMRKGKGRPEPKLCFIQGTQAGPIPPLISCGLGAGFYSPVHEFLNIFLA